MTILHLDFLSSVLYGAVFLGLIFRKGLFQWFWFAVVLWLGISILGSKLLPGIWGFTHTGPLFIPHFYLTLGSIFFFLDHWHKQPDGIYWNAGHEYRGLALFAVSNVLMSFAFMLFLFAAYSGLFAVGSVFVLSALLKLYALKPLYWFAAQFVLMAVLYLHREKINGQSAALFSKRQLLGGLTVAAVIQLATVFILIMEGHGVFAN